MRLAVDCRALAIKWPCIGHALAMHALATPRSRTARYELQTASVIVPMPAPRLASFRCGGCQA
eukprot:4661117-Lingulodinium_polyedra.AAC.1